MHLKILFVSRTRSDQKDKAYNYRLLMLQQGLQRLGMETDFLYLADWIRPGWGDRTTRVPPFLFPFRFSGLIPQLKQYDAIHAGNSYVASAFCFFKKQLHASIVHDMHGNVISEIFQKWRLEKQKLKHTFNLLEFFLLQEVTIHHADYHLVVSLPLQKELLAHGVPRNKILLNRNGVDVEKFKTKNTPRRGTFTICYAGGFQVWQGVDSLVEAGQMLEDLDIKLKFVGLRQTHQDRIWGKRIKNSLGSKAELVGRVGHQELIGHLQSADVLVSPRPYNPANTAMFPCKFPEYIALGKPVIVTDVGDTPYFVRKYGCGFVCHPSPSGLAAAIRKAYNMGRPKLRIMGERGRRLAETTFTWKTICQEYYDFLTRKKGA
jgi:glycosyltransferase involved in cell wall biosynthesis